MKLVKRSLLVLMIVGASTAFAGNGDVESAGESATLGCNIFSQKMANNDRFSTQLNYNDNDDYQTYLRLEDGLIKKGYQFVSKATDADVLIVEPTTHILHVHSGVYAQIRLVDLATNEDAVFQGSSLRAEKAIDEALFKIPDCKGKKDASREAPRLSSVRANCNFYSKMLLDNDKEDEAEAAANSKFKDILTKKGFQMVASPSQARILIVDNETGLERGDDVSEARFTMIDALTGEYKTFGAVSSAIFLRNNAVIGKTLKNFPTCAEIGGASSQE